MNSIEKQLEEVSETQKTLRKDVEKQLQEMIQAQTNLREELLETKASIEKKSDNSGAIREEISETSDSD